jgi:subtilisin family serine protease
MVALVAAASMTASAQEPPRQPPPAGGFVAGRILVKFKPGVGGLNAQRTLTAQSLTVAGAIPSIDVLKVSVKPGQELEQIAALRSNPNVLYAEPDYIARAQPTIPNDFYYGDQWGLSKIDAPTAWDITTGTSDVIIAIVDTGIDLTHPDLSCAGKLWVNPGEIPANSLDDDGNGKVDDVQGWNFANYNNNPDDDNGHGTHVAGIAAACSDNSIGVAGLAGGATLMPVKVLDSNGSGYYSDVADGIIYAVNNGAKVVNLSLGGLSNDYTLAGAVQYAYGHGALVAAAAGNCAQDGYQCSNLYNPVMYPAAYTTVMAVAATDSSDDWANFSEYLPYVSVAAPGVVISSTIREGGYGAMTGTSMATPHVSGLAALLWSFAPSLTVDQVRSTIESTSDDLGAPGKDDYFGWGRINAGRALRSLGLQTSPAQAFFVVGDNSGPFPASSAVQVTTASQDPITWTATISPPVAWLSVAPPGSGMVSAASSPPAEFALVATRPITYGAYTSTAVVTASTSSGGQVSPVTTQVYIRYLTVLYLDHLPIVLKGSSDE